MKNNQIVSALYPKHNTKIMDELEKKIEKGEYKSLQRVLSHAQKQYRLTETVTFSGESADMIANSQEMKDVIIPHIKTQIALGKDNGEFDGPQFKSTFELRALLNNLEFAVIWKAKKRDSKHVEGYLYDLSITVQDTLDFEPLGALMSQGQKFSTEEIEAYAQNMQPTHVVFEVVKQVEITVGMEEQRNDILLGGEGYSSAKTQRYIDDSREKTENDQDAFYDSLQRRLGLAPYTEIDSSLEARDAEHYLYAYKEVKNNPQSYSLYNILLVNGYHITKHVRYFIDKNSTSKPTKSHVYWGKKGARDGLSDSKDK